MTRPAGATPRWRRWKPFVLLMIQSSVAIARARRSDIEDVLGALSTLAGTPVIEGHGDLHVGQVFHVDGRFVVTDFDGNPGAARPGADAARSRRPSTSRAWRSRWRTPRSSPASMPTLDAAGTRRRRRRGREPPFSAHMPTARRTRPRRPVRSGTVARLPPAAGAPRDRLCGKSSAPVDVCPRRGPARPARREDRVVNPDAFAADLYRKPEVLRRLAATLAAGNPWADSGPAGHRAGRPARHGVLGLCGWRRGRPDAGAGHDRLSELASSHCCPPWGEGTLVVATSATGGSAETLDALDRLPPGQC